MATKAIVMEEFISADQIKSEDIRCPKCSGNTLMLYGNSQVTRTETMVEGKLVEAKIDEESHAFELEIIECLACSTRFRIKTEEVMALEQRNEQLRQIIIDKTGEDPYGLGKPC